MLDKIKSFLFRAKMNVVHGVDVRDNTGFSTEEVVIRYKDFYLYVYINQDTGEPYDFGWSNQPISHVPVRDFYIARKK